MESKQSSPKTGWLVAASVLISLLLIPLVLERLLLNTAFIEKVDKYANLFILSYFFAQPLGWLNTFIGYRVLSEKPGTGIRVTAIIGFVLGILGILTGLYWNADFLIASGQ